MNLETLVPIIAVATLTFLGNVLYFGYKFKTEKRKDVLEDQLTKLLLPLYTALKNDELEIHAWLAHGDVDPYDYEADMPKRIYKEVKEIIEKNLHLADDELHKNCLDFIVWVHKSDSMNRFQRGHEGKLDEDEVFTDFRDVVYKKFTDTRKKFLVE